jgi:hypothetical protein
MWGRSYNIDRRKALKSPGNLGFIPAFHFTTAGLGNEKLGELKCSSHDAWRQIDSSYGLLFEEQQRTQRGVHTILLLRACPHQPLRLGGRWNGIALYIVLMGSRNSRPLSWHQRQRRSSCASAVKYFRFDGQLFEASTAHETYLLETA